MRVVAEALIATFGEGRGVKLRARRAARVEVERAAVEAVARAVVGGRAGLHLPDDERGDRLRVVRVGSEPQAVSALVWRA